MDSTPADLEKLATRLRERRRKEILLKQEELRKKWGLPPTSNSSQSVQSDIVGSTSSLAVNGKKGRNSKPNLTVNFYFR